MILGAIHKTWFHFFHMFDFELKFNWCHQYRKIQITRDDVIYRPKLLEKIVSKGEFVTLRG